MPNPLMNTRRNTSTETQDHGRIDPIPEVYDGDNHAYRGTETHGVEDTERTPEERDYEGTVPGTYRVREETPEPVPVRIVTAGGRELRRFRVMRSYASGEVSRIVGRNETRATIKLRNLANITVWIGSDSAVQTFTGYPLPANTELSLVTEDAIWAVSEDGSSCALAVIEEYSVRE